MSGGGKSGDVTVGYRYFLGMHMALCHGPIDAITKIEVDGRVAWEGINTGGSIDVQAADLFGGDKREGGVAGTVDIEFGKADQQPNDYLSSVLPGVNPAYRGVAAAVLRQCYVGNNPYLKPWAFTSQRIHVDEDGSEQWNDLFAEIGRFGESTLPGCETLSLTFIELGGSFIETTKVLGTWDWPFPVEDFTASQSAWGGNFEKVTISSTAKGEPFECQDPYGQVMQLDYAPGIRSPGYLQNGTNGSTYFSAVISGQGSGTKMTGTIVDCRRTFSVSINGGSANNVAARIIVSLGGVDLGGGVYETVLSINITGSSGVNDQTVTQNIGIVGDVWNVLTCDAAVGGAYVGKEGATEWVYCLCTAFICVGGQTISNNLAVKIAGGNTASVLGESTITNTNFLLACDMMVAGFGTTASSLDCGVLEDAREGGVETFCNDMNPAHIIRECLTQSWGLGYQDADIDDTSFTSAANDLFFESMGVSILWDREIPIEDFISEILRHIDAVLYVSRETGKFVLKLIRDDYDVDSLLTLDETNSRMATDANRPAIGELVTSVTVNFTDSEQDEEEGSVTVHNEALIQLQGAVNNATVNYPGFMTRSLASRVALRDLRTLSTPLLSCDVEANREAAELNIGDVFVLNYPEQGIYNLVMRIESMSVGDGRDNTVKISCIEDAFSIPDFDVVGDPGTGWVDPVNGTPEESQPRLMIESPYYELVQRVGDREAGLILDDEPDAGFIHANGGRQGGELNADLLVSSGGSYVDSGVLDFAPYAYLSADAWYSDSKLYYTNGKDLDTVTFPALAQVGEEIIRVDSLGVDSNGAHFNVGRGVLDTVPAEHVVNSNGLPIVFFDPTTDNIQYTASDTVSIKLLTALGSQRLTEAAAPVDTITFDSRAIRPYPPGNLEIDLESYPRDKIWDGMHTLTWAHRDRLQQTSGTIFDYTEGDIGPEAGTTYKVTADAILTGGSISGDFIEVDVGSATEWEQDSNTDSSVGPPPVDADYIRFKVTSYRGGYASWQPAMVVIPYPEPIDSIGIDSAPDSFPTDPDFANVSLLLHMDGTDGSTTFIDSSSNSVTVTANGNAQIDTAQSKFGGSSALFDGSGDWLNCGNANSLLDPSSDFTIEFFARPSLLVATSALCSTRYDGASGVQGWTFRLQTDGKIRVFAFANDSSSSTIIDFTSSTAININVWVHVAVVSFSGTWTLYINGVSVGSDTGGASVGHSASSVLGIGGYNDGAGAPPTSPYSGWIDEFRLSNGVARYTAAFTPPTAPFPDA